jgi:predicted NUDIX family NTP pyrophosphohydrolase
MPNRTSAGIVVYRWRAGTLEVLLGHMGGPYWARKDDGAWSIPKGEYGEDEAPFAAAVREFEEELGAAPPTGDHVQLDSIVQANGKRVTAWAVEGEFDEKALRSNTFSMEWPRGSGRMQDFPEIDRAAWFDLDTARRKVVRGQDALFDLLAAELSRR